MQFCIRVSTLCAWVVSYFFPLCARADSTSQLLELYDSNQQRAAPDSAHSSEAKANAAPGPGPHATAKPSGHASAHVSSSGSGHASVTNHNVHGSADATLKVRGGARKSVWFSQHMHNACDLWACMGGSIMMAVVQTCSCNCLSSCRDDGKTCRAAYGYMHVVCGSHAHTSREKNVQARVVAHLMCAACVLRSCT